MNSPITFMEKAKSFIKNPLGIIALFISLIYGFACLILGLSFDHFKSEMERLPLIWFIITFPILILATFVYLVIHHHGKLYAPSDYKDEGNFFKTLDPVHQSFRLQSKIKAIQSDIDELPQIKDVEEQKQNEVSRENENTEKLKDKYVIAEDLALRAFEQGKNLTIRRYSQIVGRKAVLADFDAIAFDKDFMYGIDVRFTIHAHLSKILEERITDKFKGYKNEVKELEFIGNLKIVVIIISENKDITWLKKDLDQLVLKVDFPIEVIAYSFNELKQRFGYT